MRRIENETLRDLDEYLTAIEREENVTVVAAWVMGSHARNVASDESDIDIRFVFVQPVLDYPSLTRRRMSIRTTGTQVGRGVPFAARTDNVELEFMGWNALQFLEFLGGREKGNNPSAIECLCSPLTIRTHPTIADLQEYVDARFNVIELFNHYRSLAKKNWMRYIENDSDPTVKRMLYILRGVVYARYIRDTHDLPTLDLLAFTEDAPAGIFEGIGRERFRTLVEMKSNNRGGDEIDTTPFAETLDEFCESGLENPYPNHVRDIEMDPEELDEFMFRLIRDAQR